MKIQREDIDDWLVGDGAAGDGAEKISAHVGRGDKLDKEVPATNQVKLDTHT